MRALLLSVMMAAASLIAGPARAIDWVEVKTTHFILYGKKSDRDLPQLATRLELLNRLLEKLMNVTSERTDNSERPLLVYVVSQSEVTQNAGSSTVAGFYASGLRNGYAIVKQGKGGGTFDLGQEQILFHEFAHHFMLANVTGAYPGWYVEGFAEFFSTLEFKDDKSILFGKVPMYRAPALVMADLYPMAKLLHGTSAGLNLQEGDRYYGTAWLLTHYLTVGSERNKELVQYLNDLASPGGAKEVGSYFAGGEAALAKELNAYRRGKLKGYSLPLSSEGMAPPAIRPLAPDENALLIDELRFKRPMGSDDAAALAADVRKVAAGFADSAYAQAFLAEVEADLGAWEPALAAADTALRLDSANARAHAARAQALWGKAKAGTGAIDYKPVVQEIVAANKADLEDPYPLYLYFLAKRSQGPVSDIALQGLRKAFLQLPQNSMYRWAYAEAMAQRKDYAEAILVITPLANDPHGGRGALAAQRKREDYMALRDGKPLPVRVDEVETKAE